MAGTAAGVEGHEGEQMAQEITRAFLGRPAMHLCVDMQNIFADETDWKTPWMDRVLPEVGRLIRHRPDDTVFTRFIPPETPDDAQGAWRDYFQHWAKFTRSRIDPRLLEIVPELLQLSPSAPIIDKGVYSPFANPELQALLEARGIQTLIVSGAETDVCVLAAVMGAVDLGYHLVLAKDALCSSTDSTHDALIELYASRFSRQIALATVDEIIEHWVI